MEEEVDREIGQQARRWRKVSQDERKGRGCQRREEGPAAEGLYCGKDELQGKRSGPVCGLSVCLRACDSSSP